MLSRSPGVSITNFTKSWKDGLAFGALIAHWRPDLLDYYSLDPDEGEDNCDRAFAAAEKAGVAILLDAEDVVEYQDKKSIYTQLTQYHRALNHLAPRAAGGKISGGGGGSSAPKAKKITPEVKAIISRMQTLETKLKELNVKQVEMGEGQKLFEELKALLPLLKKHGKEWPDELGGTVQSYNRLNRDLPIKVNSLMDKIPKKQLNGPSKGASCVVCKKALSGSVLEAAGGYYHVACFKCSACNKKLTSTCLNINNKPFCDACGRKEFAKNRR